MSSGITFTFHHVVIWVTDTERSLKFYNELPGFVPERQHETADSALEAIFGVKDAKVRTAFGAIAGVNLEFVEPILPPFEELNKHPGQALSRRPGLETIAFDVDDMDKTLEHLRRIGAPLDGEPVRFSAGLRSTFTHDPDGARIELIWRPTDSPFR